MEPKLRIPDPETRAITLAKLREATRQGDLAILLLDETLALADADLLRQRTDRTLRQPNCLPTEQVED
jgi:hypothetical protein